MGLPAAVEGGVAGAGRGCATHHGANARENLPELEGLGDEVVGPGLQPDHAVDQIALSREHDDGKVGALPDIASQRKPVFARHHEIEQHAMDRLALERGAHGAAVGGIADLESLLDEVATKHRTDARLVIHHQDVHQIAHFRSVTGAFIETGRLCRGCHRVTHFALLRC